MFNVISGIFGTLIIELLKNKKDFNLNFVLISQNKNL